MKPIDNRKTSQPPGRRFCDWRDPRDWPGKGREWCQRCIGEGWIYIAPSVESDALYTPHPLGAEYGHHPMLGKERVYIWCRRCQGTGTVKSQSLTRPAGETDISADDDPSLPREGVRRGDPARKARVSASLADAALAAAAGGVRELWRSPAARGLGSRSEVGHRVDRGKRKTRPVEGETSGEGPERVTIEKSQPLDEPPVWL